MNQNEIVGYEPLVNELKQLIQQKQYQVLKMINSETINLYWEIGGRWNLLFKFSYKRFTLSISLCIV